MRNRGIFGILIVIIGLLLLILGAFAVYSNIVAINNPPALPIVVTQPVYVAAVDMPLGHVITDTDLRSVEFPVDVIPRGAVSDASQATGRIVNENISEGEMLLTTDLADPTNVQGDLGFVLSNDHVIMAFPADDRLSNLDILERGDIVDIYASLSISVANDDPTTEDVDETSNELITFDVMQGQPITALIVNITEESSSEPVAYLLALNPQDALVLKNLLDQGAIFDIVLRNPSSQLIFRLDPVSLQYIVELYGLEIVLP